MSEELKGSGGEGIKPPLGLDEELTPDLKAEKREIEARVEQHHAKLLEIAKVFGIDTCQFSDEQDRRLAELERTLEEYPKGQTMISLGYRNRHTTIVDDYQMQRIDILKIKQKAKIRDAYDLWDNEILDWAHDMISMNDMGRSIMTEEELTQQFYFSSANLTDMGIVSLVHDINDDFAVLHLKKIAQQDSDSPLANAIISLSEKPKGRTKFRDLEREHPELMITLWDVARSPLTRSERYDQTLLLAARTIARLNMIYGQRSWYLAELARSGDTRFTRVGKGEIYNISEDFKFTEKDARKARELNLPWSRVEKEMGEESAEE